MIAFWVGQDAGFGDARRGRRRRVVVGPARAKADGQGSADRPILLEVACSPTISLDLVTAHPRNQCGGSCDGHDDHGAERPTSPESHEELCGPGRCARRRSCWARARPRASPRPCSGANSAARRPLSLPRAARRPSVPPSTRPSRPSAQFADDAHRRRRDRPRRRYPALRHRRAGRAGRAGNGRAGRMRRPRLLADGLLPDHGGDRRPRASTAVFVNAHHSIGIRALVLFGTPEQQARWLPPLARGEKLAAFALTESRPARTPATCRPPPRPAQDGQTYILNGSKRYITNGAIADVLTVMARTPDPKGRRIEGHGLPGHARPAGLRGGRGADAQVRHPRHRDGPAGVPRHAGAGGEHPRPAGQGAEGRPDGARLRPHDLRRQLHGAGQGLPRRRDPPRRPPPPVRPPAGRPRADQEEARLPRRDCLCHGGDDLRDRRPDRSRGRGLHARDRHPQGLLDRGCSGRASTRRSRSTAARATSATSRSSG